MTTRQPQVGELVEVIDPHPEAGARGVVRQKYAANAEKRTRARVEFHAPFGEGFGIIDIAMLRAIR